jgi:AraC family transcriptional regulator
MSQRSPFPQDNLDFMDCANKGAASCRNIIGTAPVTAYLDYLNESGSVARGHAVEGAMTLPLPHIDVVLAIAPHGPGGNCAAQGNAILSARCLRTEFDRRTHGDVVGQAVDNTDCVDDLRDASAFKSSDDAVIKRLSDALAATESAVDRHTGIYADALRLAIVARLLGLQSETLRRPDERTGRTVDGSVERQMRALQKWRLKRVIEYVDNHLSGKITLLDLAVVAGLSRMHFAAQFREATGFRPHEYILRRRIQRAKELLLQSTMTLVEIALTVGFQTQAHFTTVFKRIVGDTPYQWRSAHCVKA